ncbi:GHMP kinase [Candidatus Woesebacteria bacterium]|nr:GHMP kinase [Candidatus Woesebacteria bacterium]
MIVVRAPLRISFMGGGTDIAKFYSKYGGKVISTTIDKYVNVVINRTPLIPRISVKYSVSEVADKPEDISHTRVRAGLMCTGIRSGIEIASFSTLPSKTGLGSSSSFTAALLMGLYAFTGKKISKKELAEESCTLEIETLGEPIGKQDQYAAVYGGFNTIEFRPNGKTIVKPVLIDYKTRTEFEDRLILLYTGITRDASSVLTVQKANMEKKVEQMKFLAASVDVFKKELEKGNFKKLGEMLHEAWLAKKSLAYNMSNKTIDRLYDTGRRAGAWGGKILGAGGGGCILFLSPKSKKSVIKEALTKQIKRMKLKNAKIIPFSMVQSGTEILFNGEDRSNHYV